MRRRPDFIIIGAMKCATSTLHDQLALQPAIFMTDPKEPNFFSDDDVYARGLHWYDGLFADAGIDALCGESSTHYTKRPRYRQTVVRMQRHLPAHTRFVYVMRDPVERIISQYVHEWTRRTISGTIDQAVARYPSLIDYSRYAMQLDPFLEAFGTDRVCPVFFERLTAEPQSELERICRFLGFDGAPTWQAQRAAANVSAARERRSRLRVCLRNVPGMRRLLHAIVPEDAWERSKQRWWRLSERPVPGDAAMQSLHAALDPDLERLGNWFGLSLSCANFAEQARHAEPQWRDAPRRVAAS